MTKNENKWRDRVHIKLMRSRKLLVASEVPVFGKSADLVIREGRKLIVIEFKITKWRTAIKQAVRHRLSADYSYVCLPRRLAFKTQVINAALEADIGVMTPKLGNGLNNLEVVLNAPKSLEIWPTSRKHLLAAFQHKRLNKKRKKIHV